MPNRARSTEPQNLKSNRQKNVRDPSEHPQGSADYPAATKRRKKVSGDAAMRLPFEHDETGDAQEKAGGTDKLLEQAQRDATSGQQDTDQRASAVDVFNRRAPRAPRKR